MAEANTHIHASNDIETTQDKANVTNTNLVELPFLSILVLLTLLAPDA